MTNGEKFLKDGVDIRDFANGINEAYLDSYDEEDLVDSIYRWLGNKVKPTITEDEKVILKNINTDKYKKIGRHKSGEIIFRNVNDSYVVITHYFKFENMFQFIKPRRRI